MRVVYKFEHYEGTKTELTVGLCSSSIFQIITFTLACNLVKTTLLRNIFRLELNNDVDSNSEFVVDVQHT